MPRQFWETMDLSGHGLGNFQIFLDNLFLQSVEFWNSYPVAIEYVIFKKMLEKFMTISEPDPGFI